MWATGRALAARWATVAALCAGLIAAGCSSAQPAPQPKPSANPLTLAISTQLDSRTAEDHVRAIIVDVDGHRRFERYYASSPGRSRSAFSVTKSVMSTLIGIAIGAGKLRLDEPLSEMLPRYAPIMKPSVARVTLRQLLTMTGGFPDDWNGEIDQQLEAAPDWTRFILTHQEVAPGTQFHYSNYGAHLLSPILVQATGQSALAYARTKLFDPLGIITRPGIEPRYEDAHVADYQRARFAWPVDPQGFNTGAHSIKLRPRDMATLGQLFLQDGRWRGRQLVPADWVNTATVAQAGNAFDAPNIGAFHPQNYGYEWWVQPTHGADAYYAWGLGGQLIEVVPQRHIVIVVSTDVGAASEVGPDDIQNLVDVITAAIK